MFCRSRSSKSVCISSSIAAVVLTILFVRYRLFVFTTPVCLSAFGKLKQPKVSKTEENELLLMADGCAMLWRYEDELMLHKRFCRIRLTWCKESFVVPAGDMALSGSVEIMVHNLRHNISLISSC